MPSPQSLIYEQLLFMECVKEHHASSIYNHERCVCVRKERDKNRHYRAPYQELCSREGRYEVWTIMSLGVYKTQLSLTKVIPSLLFLYSGTSKEGTAWGRAICPL